MLLQLFFVILQYDYTLHYGGNAPWHSDNEIKINKLGFVAKNRTKALEHLEACVRCDKRALRMKVCNVCGDKTVFVLSKTDNSEQ